MNKNLAWKTWTKDMIGQPEPMFEGLSILNLLADNYGIVARLLDLKEGFIDITLHVVACDARQFIFKIFRNPTVEYARLDAETDLLDYFRKHGFPVPEVVLTKEGEAYGEAEFTSLEAGVSKKRFRLQTFICGALMPEDISEELCRAEGDFIGRVDAALAYFQHPYYKSQIDDVNNLIQLNIYSVRDCAEHLDDLELRVLAREFVALYDEKINGKMHLLPKQQTHGDLQRKNLIVNDEATQIIGLIDFGESRFSLRIVDAGIVLASIMASGQNDAKLANAFLQAYQQHVTFTKEEREALPIAAAARLIQTQTISPYIKKITPEYDTTYADSVFNPKHSWAAIESVVRKTGEFGDYFAKFSASAI